MAEPVMTVLATGVAASLQDGGRPGWRRFGLPPGGALDRYSARMANRLLGNLADAPVLEVMLQGARLRVERAVWMALAGAPLCKELPAGSARRFQAGEILHFSEPGPGVCAYLAVPGGFAAPSYFGSVAIDERNGLGLPLKKGRVLDMNAASLGRNWERVGHRFLPFGQGRDFGLPLILELLKGPQWSSFSKADRRRLVDQTWTISSRSDRTGFRLEGEGLDPPESIASEPVLPGSFQVPGDGRPIITLYDGPTVGGYAKIAVMREAQIDWLAQCAPGTQIRLRWVD